MSIFGDVERVEGFGGIDAVWAQTAIEEAESENGLLAVLTGPFPAELFIIDGEPERIAETTRRWSDFADRTHGAGSRIEMFDVSRFIGVEGDMYAAILSERLVDRLHLIGEVYRKLGQALDGFGQELARLQAEMEPIATEAPGAYRDLQEFVENARQGNIISNINPAAIDEGRRLLQRWRLIRGQAGDVQRKLSKATTECADDIHALAAHRFTENPMAAHIDLTLSRIVRATMEPVRDPADSLGLRTTELAARMLAIGDAASAIAPSVGSVASSAIGAVGTIAGLVAGPGSVAGPQVTLAAGAVAAAAPFVAATAGVVGTVAGTFGRFIAHDYGRYAELQGALLDTIVGSGVHRRIPGSIVGEPTRAEIVFASMPTKLLAEHLGWKVTLLPTGEFVTDPERRAVDVERSMLLDTGGLGIFAGAAGTVTNPRPKHRKPGAERFTDTTGRGEVKFTGLLAPGPGHRELTGPDDRGFVLIEDTGTPLRAHPDSVLHGLTEGESVTTPRAYDALGRAVDVELRRDGDDTVLAVHPDEHTLFPVLAEPAATTGTASTTPVAVQPQSGAPAESGDPVDIPAQAQPQSAASGDPADTPAQAQPQSAATTPDAPDTPVGAQAPSAATAPDASAADITAGEQPQSETTGPDAPPAAPEQPQLSPIQQAVAPVLAPAQQAMSVLASALGAVAPSIAAQGTAWDVAVPGAGAKLASAASSLTSAASALTSAANSLAALALATTHTDRAAAIAGFFSGLSSAAAALVSAAAEATATAPAVAKVLVERVAPAAQSAAQSALAAFTEAIPALTQAAANTLNSLVPAVTAALPHLQGALAGFTPLAQTAAGQLSTALTEAVTTVVPQITAAAAELGGAAAGLSAQAASLSSAVSFAGLGLSAVAAVPSVLAIMDALPNLVAAFGDYLTSWVALQRASFMALAPGLTSGVTEVVKLLTPTVNWQAASAAVYPGILAANTPDLPRAQVAAGTSATENPRTPLKFSPTTPAPTAATALRSAMNPALDRIASIRTENPTPTPVRGDRLTFTPTPGPADRLTFSPVSAQQPAMFDAAGRPLTDRATAGDPTRHSDAEFAQKSVLDRDLASDVAASAPSLVSGALSVAGSVSGLQQAGRAREHHHTPHPD
ncbi:hypothetical protein ACFWPJ_27655, partial [Nocardia sp. NPDC058497]